MEVKQIQSIADIAAADWNRLTGKAYPFLRHEFLLALEQSGAVSKATGWEPAHLLVMDGNRLCGLLPLYLKHHSWGEFVFDQQWAQAYQQQGLAYYPKWLSTIPLTPCQGARVVVDGSFELYKVSALLLAYIQQRSQDLGISSWHCLFPLPPQAELLQTFGLSLREGVQFHWFNRCYDDFQAFLDTMSADKRKMIKRERRRVGEQGVELLRIAGQDVSAEQWLVFYDFYALTYLKRQSQPYLNLKFFQQLAETMPEQLLLVMAIKDDQYVAAALSFVGDDTLYGRYWGCADEYNGLHFEACYYQGLEYCIEQGLQHFDSGAQGEHKISRGFEPITTYSAHWINDPRFASAIKQFVSREKQALQLYKCDAAKYLPFKNQH